MASKENMILRAFLDSRDVYDNYASYILGLKNIDRNMNFVLQFIKSFYDKYPLVNTIPEVDFKLFVDKEDRFNFMKNNENYLQTIYKTNITNTSLTLDIIESCVEQHLMARVLDKAALVLDNNQSGILSTVQDDIDEFHKTIRNPPKDMVEYKFDLDALIKEEITTPGIPFCNQFPNDVIKGMRPGQLGLIYAYVDVGKTSYGVANLCSIANYLEQNFSDRPVIYGGNEEDISRVSLRTVQCMTNWNDKEIEQNKKLVKTIIAKKGFNKIKFIDHLNTTTIIEKVLEKYKPRVLFIDQGTNVKVKGSNREGVNALEEIFSFYRDMGKKHKATMICMAQGGDDCFGKEYPSLRDIYGSKSAIQGTLDWAISVGRNIEDSKYAGWRYFDITKNKGDKGKYQCRFDADRCQFKQVV